MTAVSGRGATDADPEVGMLRRCIGDIVALSTLSAIWAGASRPKIAASLAEVLQETVGADAVYVGLRATSGALECDSACYSSPSASALCDAIRVQMAAWLRAPGPVADLPDLIQGLSVHLITPIGINAEHGVIVTVAERDGQARA